jgi:ActR/RegA family two-component response regulator
MEAARILVVDDERSILQLLNEALTHWGYKVTTAGTGRDALEALKTGVFHIAMTDIRMPDMSGLDLLREIKKLDESIEVVVMTGYPAISSAVEALKEGAYDYLSKPLILDEIQHLMARMMERRFLRGEVHSLRTRLGEELTLNELIGSSSAMERVKEIIGKVAVTDSPVLVEGESGTGKELVAAAIHRLSARAKRPFIPVNCSAIPGDLIESEFFGHVRGPSRAPSPTRSALPGRPRRHDLPRRDRRAPAEPAGQAPAGAPGDAGPAGRVDEGLQRRRSRGRGDQPQPRAGDEQRDVPAGPLLPPERGPDPAAAASRPARTTFRRS